MIKAICAIAIVFVPAVSHAAELAVSSNEPIVVTAPDGWKSEKDKPPSPNFPVETYQVVPPGDRNAVCLISIYDKDKQTYLNVDFLKTLLRSECRPYVAEPDGLSKLELKEINHGGMKGYYHNFVDPDLTSKPVKPGSFKTATPILLTLDAKYLIKVTILCDEIDGADYKDAIGIVESLRIKPE